MKSKSSATLELVKKCCLALDAKKAGDLRVLDVSEQSSITDYLIIATGTSEPHLRALRVEIEKVLDAAKAHIVGMDAARESGWMVIDAFDLMVHLFTDEHRQTYGLEKLWKDATELSVPAMIAPPKPVAAKAKPAAKKKKAVTPVKKVTATAVKKKSAPVKKKPPVKKTPAKKKTSVKKVAVKKAAKK